MRLCLTFLLSIGMIVVGFGQHYQLRIQHFTMQQGLPNDFVHWITQDRDGFMWIATNYGYARFDGYKMEIHNQNKYADYQTAIYNSARLIFQDVNGKMWIRYVSNGTVDVREQIVEIFDPLTGTITPFDQAFEQIAPFKMQQIRVLQSDSAFGMCIITSDNTIYRYDGRFNKIGRIDVSKGLPTLLTAISNNTFWLLDSNKKQLYEVTRAGKISTIAFSKSITSICTDQHGDLWMLPNQLGQIWRKAPGKPIEITPLSDYSVFNSDDDIKPIALDYKDRLWCFERHRVCIYNRSGKLLFKANFVNIEDLDNNNISRIQIDQANNAWLSSPHGVYRLSLYESPFTNYMTDKGIQDIRGITVDERNHIYVNQLYLYQIDQKERIIAGFQGIGSIKDGNTIWNGNYNKNPGVFKYDILTQKTTFIRVDSALSTNTENICIPYKSKRTGRIWLGGIKILAYLDAADTVATLFNNYGDFPELKNKCINWMYENKEGIWLGTTDGLYLLDESKGGVQQFIAPLAKLNIAHIYEDRNGVFWLATRGNGLWRWDRITHQFTSFTQEEGLSNDVIYAVYEDDYGYLWIPSNYGLMRFNKITHEVNTYLPKDGIPHQEFNYTSHTRAPDGRLFFGGLGGVTSFHPKDFLDRENESFPLQIIRFKKVNATNGILEDYTTALLRNREIILNPGERALTLEVALLNYESPNDSRYAYRIDGLEEKWNYANTNSIWISQLPYGRYTLRIKAQDANKHWSKQEISIPIFVKMPFYRHLWFYLLTAALLVIFIVGVVRFRINQLQRNQQYLQAEVDLQTEQIRQQTAKLQALDEQKSRFFLNVAHELRTPLTLISSPIDLFLQNESVDPKISTFLQSIRNNAQHLLELVESILDLASYDAQKLKLVEQSVHFHTLVRGIFEMYESSAELHGINYHFQYEARADLTLLLDVPKFEKVLHNLLSNALKFTPTGGRITLQIQEKETSMLLQVIDTGIGIAPPELPHVFERYFQAKSNGTSYGGTGMGLNIAQEYAQLMQGTLHATSTLQEGSTFSFHFPKKETTLDVISTDSDITNKKEPASKAKLEDKKSKAQTILLVEDHVAMQELLRQIVSPTYEVMQAVNGKMALEILEKQTIHGIVTDIMMPEMDGFELVERIKGDPRWQHIPIIVLTARANEVDKLQALRIGVDDYLYKPFSPQELQARLKNLLSNQQRRSISNKLSSTVSPDLMNADQQWLMELENKTQELLKQNPDFKSTDIAALMNVSEVHLRRKIRSISGLSANDYIKEIRLQRARQLLEHKVMTNVSEVAYAVGFATPRYFTELYIARFGKKPSSYLRNEYKEL